MLGQPPGLRALPRHTRHRHLDAVSFPATQCLSLDGFMCPTPMPLPVPPLAHLGSKTNVGEAAPCSPQKHVPKPPSVPTPFFPFQPDSCQVANVC